MKWWNRKIKNFGFAFGYVQATSALHMYVRLLIGIVREVDLTSTVDHEVDRAGRRPPGRAQASSITIIFEIKCVHWNTVNPTTRMIRDCVIGPAKTPISSCRNEHFSMLLIGDLILKIMPLAGTEIGSKISTLLRAEIFTLSHNQKYSFVIEWIFKTRVSICWRLVHVKRLCLFVYHIEIHHVKPNKMRKIELILKWIGGRGR